MEVAVCGEVVSFDFPIVEGTLYLAVDLSQFCDAECVIPPMHVRDKVCKGFLLVAQLLLRPPLLDGGYFLRSPGCVSCRSFLQERNTCVEVFLLQSRQPCQTLLGQETILDSCPDIGNASLVPFLLNGGCITPGMTLDCDFLRRFFNPKNFANFASEIDPASFEVRLEPSFREADTLWKSPGFILNPKSEKCR